MSLEQKSYSEARMLWFHKTTAMSQAIITLPMIGFITGQQAIIMFGVGLPALFITMNITGEITHGFVPFIFAVLFAMIRPPVMSYEARAYTKLRFMLVGGGRKKSGGPKSKSKTLQKPSKSLTKPDKTVEIPEPAGPAPPMDVSVTAGAPVEVAITLKTRNNTVLAGRKVRVVFDGVPVKTAVSSSSGQVITILDPEDCTGTKQIAICEVTQDDMTGPAIIQRDIAFRQMK